MNCPKCGFEQEERLDCKKCGVVFSKYLAMQAEVTSPSAAPVPQAENGTSVAAEILELRQSVRDLGRRFSEVEFERVERGQIRGELKTLDKKCQAGFDQFSRRMEDLEKLLTTPQMPPPLPDDEHLAEVQREILEANVDPISKRLADAEQRIQRWETELSSFREIAKGELSRLAEFSTGPLAGRLDEIEQRLQRWEREFVPANDSVTTDVLGRFEARLNDLESKIGVLQSPQPEREPDPRYHELQAQVHSLADDIATLKSATDMLPAHQADLVDIRAEIGKVWTQIQGLESTMNRPQQFAAEVPAYERLELDIRSIRDSLQEIREFISRVSTKA